MLNEDSSLSCRNPREQTHIKKTGKMQKERGEKGQMAVLISQYACLYASYVCRWIVYCSFLMYGVTKILCSLNRKSPVQKSLKNRTLPINDLILYSVFTLLPSHTPHNAELECVDILQIRKGAKRKKNERKREPKTREAD